jgi:hypothetical protein
MYGPPQGCRRKNKERQMKNNRTVGFRVSPQYREWRRLGAVEHNELISYGAPEIYGRTEGQNLRFKDFRGRQRRDALRVRLFISGMQC